MTKDDVKGLAWLGMMTAGLMAVWALAAGGAV